MSHNSETSSSSQLLSDFEFANLYEALMEIVNDAYPYVGFQGRRVNLKKRDFSVTLCETKIELFLDFHCGFTFSIPLNVSLYEANALIRKGSGNFDPAHNFDVYAPALIDFIKNQCVASDFSRYLELKPNAD